MIQSQAYRPGRNHSYAGPLQALVSYQLPLSKIMTRASTDASIYTLYRRRHFSFLPERHQTHLSNSVQALVICPTEHIKCRLQIQNNIGFKEQIFKGPFDAVDKILSSHGIRGLYRGFICTGWREIPAFGLYFATYDLVKEKTTYILSKTLDGGTEEDEVPGNDLHLWAASSLAGGVSGAFTWAMIYPFDVIKTKIQTTPINTPTEKTRMLYITRQIMKQHGWRFFFRGLGVTVMRAFPVNAIIFPTYELTLMQLTSNGFGTPVMNEHKI